jgi:oligopeptide transport system substrate-binding protein
MYSLRLLRGALSAICDQGYLMKLIHNIFLVLPILISCLLLTGCGGENKETTSDISGRKTRYMVLGAKVRGLDPGDIGDVTSSSIASQFYECLYQYHFLKRPYELIPCLAAAMPEVSDDSLTYTIRLRDDVYFFDDPCFPGGKGRKLVANDFIYAWKRIANIKNLSKNWWIFDSRIVGLDEFREYTKTVKHKKNVDYSRPIEGLVAVDNLTLRIKLTKPWPQINHLLAHLPTAPMAKEAVDYYGDQIINVAVGTGPFILKQGPRGTRIVMVRNPNFRKEYYPSEGEPGDKEKGYLDDAGKELPQVDELVFTLIEEDQPRWLMFLQGKIDATGIPKDNYSQAVTAERTLTPFLKKKGIDLVIQDDPSTFWFGFNLDDPVIGKNLPLRRAMSCAWDRQEFIEVFMNGRGIAAKGVFPPMFEEFDKDYVNPWAEYNLERAKELLAEAEKIHGGKITVTLSMPGVDTLFRQMGQYFKRSMARIGLTVKLDYMDWPTFQDRVKTKSTQIFAMGWVGDYPDGETFLQLFYGPNESPGPNDFNYKNPEYDKLYRKISVMNESEERLKIYRQMERMICDDVPAIFSYHPVAFVPYYTYLKNYKPNNFAWGAAKYSNIDLQKRKELIGR